MRDLLTEINKELEYRKMKKTNKNELEYYVLQSEVESFCFDVDELTILECVCSLLVSRLVRIKERINDFIGGEE